MQFPDLYRSDFKKNDFEKVKRALDFAISLYENSSSKRTAIIKNYDSYNGIVDPKSYESLVKPYGKLSKTKYVHYNNGLNKIKTLIGEFLGSPIDPKVETINEEHINKKFDKFLESKAFVDIKSQIETAKLAGYDLFPGMLEEMDDEENFLSPKNFMTENERILTKYLKDKIKKSKLKLKFKKNMIDIICSNEMFGRVETINGIDDYRAISPIYSMSLDSGEDGFCEDQPYIGEKRMLFLNQIIKEFDITSEKEIEEIKAWEQDPGTFLQANTYERKNNALLIPVYTIEFKTVANNRYFKFDHTTEEPYIREITKDEYEKRIKNNNPDSKIELQKLYIEEVWEASRIGQTMYKKIKRTTRQANTLKNNKLYARYNYIHLVAEDVNGMSIPIQSVISKLDRTYNDIMFLINKELKKPSGNALAINQGYLPSKTNHETVMNELTEDGVIKYNTAAEGNKFGLEGRSEQAVTGINLGDKGRAIDTLLRLKMDIEAATDRITGITRGRTGGELATTTATTSNNNLETSRTVTYDIFYNGKEFFDEVMTRLVDKGKLNFIEYNPQVGSGLFTDEDFNFIMSTSDIALEFFNAYINDGRKESLIREKIEALFLGEINSGTLRSKDVAKFYLQDSLDEGLKVLDNAWKEINNIQQQSQKSNNELALQQEQIITQRETQAREDLQAHELEKINLEGEIESNNILLEGRIKSQQKSSDNVVKMATTDKKLMADTLNKASKQTEKVKPKNSKN